MDESTLLLLESANDQDLIRLLKEFNTKFDSQFPPLGLKEITLSGLWEILMRKLKDEKATHTHQPCLATIKILSRDKGSLHSVVNSDRLSVIVKLAGLVTEEEALLRINQQINYDVVIEAQKCLSNLVYNSVSIQRLCCVNSTLPGLMCRLKTFKDPDLPHTVKYFDMRLLFLLTAFCADIRPRLRCEYHGLTYLIEILDLSIQSGHEYHDATRTYPPLSLLVFNDEDSKVINEVLKVLYNLVLYIDKCTIDEQQDSHCLKLITVLRSLLLASCTCTQHTDTLHSNTVNLLLVLPPRMYEELLPNMPQQQQQQQQQQQDNDDNEDSGCVGGSGSSGSSSLCHKPSLLPPPVVTTQPTAGATAQVEASCFTEVDTHTQTDNNYCEYDGKDMSAIIQLLDFLDSRLKTPDQSCNKSLMPILSLMVEMVQANRNIRKFVRLRVLPPLRDVSRRPEEGNTLRNKLCTLMTSPLHDLKHLSANLLFILCKESVDRLIKYTGYGNAAGLLASRGLMLGHNNSNSEYSSASEDSDTEEYVKVRDMVNPVTGRYEPPRPSPLDGMTEEQKEHEAMKLINVLDKLTRNNIIQPCRIGEDGKPHPVSSVLQLQEGIGIPHNTKNTNNNDNNE